MHATMIEYSSKNSEPWFISFLEYGDYRYNVKGPSLEWPKRWHSDFLALAANFGLITYVRAKIEANPTSLAQSYGRPLAFYAMDSAHDLEGTRLPHTNIVRYLLEKDARLDRIFEGKTFWQFAVARACIDCSGRVGSEEVWVELLQLLLDLGADPNI